MSPGNPPANNRSAPRTAGLQLKHEQNRLAHSLRALQTRIGRSMTTRIRIRWDQIAACAITTASVIALTLAFLAHL